MGAHAAVTPDQAEAAVRDASNGLGADVVLEMSGVPSAVHQAFALARPGGRVNMLGIPAKTIDVDFASEIIFKGLTLYGVVGRRMYDTWHQMTRFLRSGNFDPRPVITHRLPLEAVDEVPAHYLDRETARDLFRALAADGDDDCARAELLLEFEPSPGSGAHFDRLMDHINTLGRAYWRLHRAERRAYGKEGA